MNAVTEHRVSPPIHEQVAKEMMENGSVVIGIRRSLTTRVLTTRWYLFSSRPGSLHIAIAATKFARNDKNCTVAIETSSASLLQIIPGVKGAVWFPVEFICSARLCWPSLQSKQEFNDYEVSRKETPRRSFLAIRWLSLQTCSKLNELHVQVWVGQWEERDPTSEV